MVLMGCVWGIRGIARQAACLLALGLVACGGNGKSTSNPSTATAGSNSGMAGAIENGGDRSTAGSSAGGAASAGSASGGGNSAGAQGGSGAGSTGVGGGSLGENVCSTDPAHCFQILRQEWTGSGNAGVDGVAFDSTGNVLVAASTLGNLKPLTQSIG